jgi:BASS family bile acid:Na+ symporter
MAVMKDFLDFSTPLYTFLVMLVVGTGLAPADFRRVVETPRTVCWASLTHMLCLPLAGIVVVSLLSLGPFVTAGVLLIAACPSGTIGNLYVHLARANAALSVTLTGVSCLAAMVTMPLAMAIFARFIAGGEVFHAPILPLLRSLTLFLLVPIVLGMLLRSRWPELVRRHDRRLRGGSLLLVAALIVQILWQAPDAFTLDLAEALQAGVAMAGLAILAGALSGLVLKLESPDFWAVTIRMMVQNIALAMTIAVTVYHQPRFATFAVAYFLVQVPIAAALIALGRHASRRRLPVSLAGRCRIDSPQDCA